MPDTTLKTTVTIPTAIIHRVVGLEMVLLNVQTGQYYGLDAVGSRMWQLLADHGTLEAVFEVMASEYDVSAEELKRDLLRLVQELSQMGLVYLEAA